MKDDKYLQEQLEKHMLEKRVRKIKKEIKLSMECIGYRKTKHWKNAEINLWRKLTTSRYSVMEKGVCYISTKGFYSELDEDVVCRCVYDFVVNSLKIKSEYVEVSYSMSVGMIKVIVKEEVYK